MATLVKCDIDRNGVRIQEGRRWARTYQARYIIEASESVGCLEAEVLARSGGARPVPIKGAAYAVAGNGADPASFALEFQWSVNPQRHSQWFCDVTWRPPDPKESPPNYTVPNPLDRSAIHWLEFEETTEIVTEAKNITPLPHLSPARPAGTLGKIVNAAGQPFDSLPERPNARPVLVLQRAYRTLEQLMGLHNTYYRKLNSDTYQGAPAKTLYVRSIQCGAPQYENGVEYFIGQIRIVYNPKGWKISLVNQGLAYLESGKLINYDKSSTGQIFTEPILLAANGSRLSPGVAGNSIEYEYSDDTVSFANIGELPP